jgi:hypothetical protein
MKRKEQTRLDGQDRGKEKLFSLQEMGPTSIAHAVQYIAADLSRIVLFFGSHRHCGWSYNTDIGEIFAYKHNHTFLL